MTDFQPIDEFEEFAVSEILREVFPYIEWVATHDARTPLQHLVLESLGINGSPVYLRNDPVLNGWHILQQDADKRKKNYCRCGHNVLTTEAAERKYGITSPAFVTPFTFDPWDRKLMAKCRTA